MTIDRAVMAFAGSMILVSLALSQVMSPYWLLLTAFVRAQPAAVGVHRLLPARHAAEAARACGPAPRSLSRTASLDRSTAAENRP